MFLSSCRFAFLSSFRLLKSDTENNVQIWCIFETQCICDDSVTIMVNTWKLIKIFSKYDMHKYVLLKGSEIFGIACQCTLLIIQVKLIVLRTTQIDFGVIKRCTITLDLILPEPGT